jgi:hypothetical protein
MSRPYKFVVMMEPRGLVGVVIIAVREFVFQVKKKLKKPWPILIQVGMVRDPYLIVMLQAPKKLDLIPVLRATFAEPKKLKIEMGFIIVKKRQSKIRQSRFV